ncbi:MAG: LuxR C-terminal-related transcriptional regulator [Parasphingorhabdus sp.]
MPQNSLVETQASTTWFSRSKTRAPKFAIKLVERKRLLSDLDTALDKPISCVVAPAGFGKSTLLSQWRDSLIARDIPCAWINLDENDREIRKFFAYLVFAIEDAGVPLGYIKKTAEHGFVDMSSAAITTSLLSAIIDIENRIVLVLDDYHRAASSEIDDFIKVLSDQCGDKVHIAIGSRAPVNINLPTLLASGQAIEIPSANLRFSDREVREAMGDDLDQEALTALQEQLEGWPVAVQMTRLLGSSKTTADHKIASQGYLADYLVTNVLESQPEELQNFLLETSTLQNFNAELANAVCHHSNSESYIRQLQSLQALVIPLDDDLEWFRYHHLFSECLSDVLKQSDPEKFVSLHRRAAIWCGENRLIVEAVNYANAIKDYELSKQIINDNCEWMRAEKFGGVGYFNGLLANIPEEEIAEDSRLLYSKAYRCILVGNFKQALKYRAAAEVLIERDGITPDTLRDRLTIGVGLLFRTEFERERDGKWLKDILEMLEGKNTASSSMNPKIHILCCLTLQSLSFGDFERAREYAYAAEVDVEHVMSIYCQINLGFLELCCNALNLSRKYFKNASRSAIKIGGERSNLKYMCDMFLTVIDYWQSSLDANPADQLEVAVLHTIDGDGGYDVYAVGFDALLHDTLFRKDFDKAELFINELEQSTERLCIERLTQLTDVLRLDFYTASESLGQAELAFNKVTKWFSVDSGKMEDHGWFHWIAASYACARYMKAIGEFKEASRYVEAGLDVAVVMDVAVPKVRGAVLKASILETIGERDKALTILEHTIKDAAGVNFPRAFAGIVSDNLLIEAVSSIIAKKPTHVVKDFATKLAVAGVQTMFSSREEEVLWGISQGKSNKEIARELVLTDNTIKFHLRNIYRKLGVKKRVSAVEKARELGIVS